MIGAVLGAAAWFLAGLGSAYTIEWLRARRVHAVAAVGGSPCIPNGCVYLEDAPDGSGEWYAVTLDGVTTRYLVADLNGMQRITSEHGTSSTTSLNYTSINTQAENMVLHRWRVRRDAERAAGLKASLPPLPDASKLTSGHGRVTVVGDP